MRYDIRRCLRKWVQADVVSKTPSSLEYLERQLSCLSGCLLRVLSIASTMHIYYRSWLNPGVGSESDL